MKSNCGRFSLLMAMASILSHVTHATPDAWAVQQPTLDPSAMHSQASRELQDNILLDLMNSDSQTLDAFLRDGLVIESKAPAFNINVRIRASTTPVQSIRLGYNAQSTYRIENTAPYTFCVNPPSSSPRLFRLFRKRNSESANSTYPKCQLLGYGNHTITVTAWSERNGQGSIIGQPRTISFSIVQPSLTLAPLRDRSVNDGFQMQLDLVGIPDEDLPTFASAAQKWSSVITGDLPDVDATKLPPRTDGCTFPAVIDDLYVCGQYQNIDGPLGILGFAGPEYARATGLPISGIFVLDVNDTENMRAKKGLYTTLLHELGHVIGIGTIWDSSNVANPAPNCDYVGPNANAQYQAISGCTKSVPTERGGAPGTTCVHWEEACMGHELMTGYFSPGNPGPMSAITVGSLADLGYSVSFSNADPFTAKDLAPGCICPTRRNLRSKHTITDMRHGETIPLGFLEPKRGSKGQRPRRRRLSDEGMDMAMQAGLDFLESQQLKPNNNPKKQQQQQQQQQLPSDVVYIGDKVVSVMVQEEGEVFGIIVRSDAR